MNPHLTHLECSKTGKHYDPDRLQGLSEAGAPLMAQYDLKAISNFFHKEKLKSRRRDMWRYRELLPLGENDHLISLGEGFTPLNPVERLRNKLDTPHLFVKDESRNPTGSFKARGLSSSVNGAYNLGARKFAIPSAGNAAGALAAYAAALGVEAHVFMPKDTPAAFQVECEAFGAEVELVDGLITTCGQKVAEKKELHGWYDVSTLKEPFRIEGKKTMGFEIAEQFSWELPDVIIYPTGGGTGLIGMWKAFNELEQLGWIGSKRPRMVAVQASGCAPIVDAFRNREKKAHSWEDAHTLASGLRVPQSVGDFLMLDILYKSKGIAIDVTDDEIIDATYELASQTGILPAPEGGATLAAFEHLLKQGWIDPSEKVVLFNTGSGYKYIEALRMKSKVSASSIASK